MKTRFLLIFLGLGLICPLYPADDVPFQISAELGFSNLIRTGRPFPFQVDLSAAQIPIEGQLHVIAHNQIGGSTVYELPVSLVPSARKRWRLTLPPISGNSVRVDIADRSGKLLTQQTFFGISVEQESPLLVVVQENTSNRFAFPRQPDASTQGGWRTGSVASEFLPEDPLAYASVSAILWRSDKVKALGEAQSRALFVWLKQGGLLVVAGGRTVPPDLPPSFRWEGTWGNLLPFSLKGFANARLLPPVRPMNMLAKRNVANWEKGTLPDVEIGIKPLQGDQTYTRLEINGIKLLTEQIVGGGLLMQLAFDPMDISSAGLVLGNDFWQQALWLPGPEQTPWKTLGWLMQLGWDSNHTQLAQLAEYCVASVNRISSVFGVFFGLAFCLNFWLFRKSRRYELAWLILIMVSIVFFLYNRAYGRVGGFGPTRQIEITYSFGVAGEKTLLSFTHAGLLSPRTLKESIQTTWRDQLLFGMDRDSRNIQISTGKQDFPVQTKPGAFNTCSSVAFEELPGEGITAQWQKTDTGIQVTLKNKTGLPLQSPKLGIQGSGMTLFTQGNDFILTIANTLLVPQTHRAPQVTTWGTKKRTVRSSRSNPLLTKPIEFLFELPSGAKPVIQSGAREIRQQRTVTLLVPVPVSMEMN